MTPAGVRILSIDGGGIRGILPATVLAELERLAGRPVHRLFDMVSGTSTGGIMACALACPDPPPASALLDLYADRGPEIFAPSLWRTARSTAAGARYDHRPLERVLASTFGEATLAAARVHLLVTAYDLEARSARFFKSWRARGVHNPPGETAADADYLLRDVARATSAAPTLFEPAAIRSRSGIRSVLVDGALVANNPTMCAIASARRLHPGTERITVVSLGCGGEGTPIRYEQARRWGAVAWARPVLECLVDGASDTVDYQVRECFETEARYFRVQDGPGRAGPCPDALDDARPENIERLVLRGRDLAARAAPQFEQMIPLLVP